MQGCLIEPYNVYFMQTFFCPKAFARKLIRYQGPFFALSYKKKMILWVHNIFYKYLENNILFSTKMKLDDSYIWRSIVTVKNIFNVESQAYGDSFNAVKREWC